MAEIGPGRSRETEDRELGGVGLPAVRVDLVRHQDEIASPLLELTGDLDVVRLEAGHGIDEKENEVALVERPKDLVEDPSIDLDPCPAGSTRRCRRDESPAPPTRRGRSVGLA